MGDVDNEKVLVLGHHWYKKEFDKEAVHNKEYLNPKTKSHGNEGTDFYDKAISKVVSLNLDLKKVKVIIRKSF